MSKRTHAHAQGRFARRVRLPRIAQSLIANHATARQFLQGAPFARMMIAGGMEPTPGLGIAEFDACVALVKDAIGLAPLSDEEFEYALRLSTPPECRETSQ
jgi:hypothetical protein